jgi:hypothetical protein
MATRRAETTLAAGTRTNSTLTKPTVSNGDIWWVAVTAEAALTGVTAGFETGVIIDHFANVHNLGIFWRRVDGSEGTSVTVNHASAWSQGYSGTIQDVSANVDPWFSIPRQDSSTTATANGVTTLGDDAFIAMIVNTFDDRAKATPSGTNPTWDERYDTANNLGVFEGTLATAGSTGDESSGLGSSSQWGAVLMVVEDAATTSGTPPPYPVMAAGQSLSTNDPSVAFGGAYVPREDDQIALFVSSATVLDVTADASLPSGWVNPLGDGVDVNSDAHGECVLLHAVTASEESGGTTTYTATDGLQAAETGYVHGVIVRHADPTTPIDSANTAVDSGNTVTPHVLAGLNGTDLSDGSLVVSSVAKDATGAYTTTPTGWSFLLTSNTTNGRATLALNAFTTVEIDLLPTNITPSGGDEYCSITLAFTKLAAGGPINQAVDSATLTLTGVEPAASGTGAATQTVDVATLTLSGVELTAAGTGTTSVVVDPATLTITAVDIEAATGGTQVAVDPATLTLVGIDVAAAGTGDAAQTVDPATLTLTGETPTAAGTGDASQTVDPATLTLQGQTPTAAGTGIATQAVDPATLDLVGVDVEAATAGGSQAVDPATLTLTGVDIEAAGTGSGGTTVDPATLTFVGVTPSAAGTGNADHPIDPATLTLVGVVPVAAGTGNINQAVDSAVLVLAAVTPTATAGLFQLVDPAALVLTGVTPIATVGILQPLDPAILTVLGVDIEADVAPLVDPARFLESPDLTAVVALLVQGHRPFIIYGTTTPILHGAHR